jgi:hypothetical protein
VRCVDGPLDAREKVSKLTGGSIAIMCPAVSTRRHVRWPRWGPRSIPSNDTASKAAVQNGFFGSSVRPAVISFSSFIPASTRGSGGHRRMPISRRARHRGPCRRAISLFNHGRSRVAVRSPEARTDRIQQSPAKHPRARCPVGCPVTRRAMRHTRPAVPRPRRSCRSGVGSGCRGRPGGGCE